MGNQRIATARFRHIGRREPFINGSMTTVRQIERSVVLQAPTRITALRGSLGKAVSGVVGGPKEGYEFLPWILLVREVV